MSLELPTGGNVIGVGTDIVDVERIRASHERHGERFLRRVFTPGEQDYCLAMKNPYPHLAARFAAKEAVSKTFTTGIGQYLGWLSIDIHKGERDQPYVVLDDKGSKLLADVGAQDVLVSLSHTDTLGHAVAVLVR